MASLNPPPSPPASLRRSDAEWKSFQEKFGTDLKADFNADGRLASVRGQLGSGSRAAPGFQASNPQKAIARAREILEAARELIGVERDWPLDRPIAKGDEVSARVAFSQSHDGVPISPGGTVTVDLGSQGELVGLYSDYVPNLEISNAASLSQNEAKAQAIAAATSSETPNPHVSGGSSVIWVTGAARAGKVSAKQAYVYTANGFEIVIDAETGRTLSRRDHRQF